jgi:SAM-dependent methyltransferase
MWTDPILLKLFQWFPPDKSDVIFKDPESRPELEYADEVARPFAAWFGMTPAELLAGKDVLDLGCGYGGRTVRFAERAASAAGVEISPDIVERGARYAAERGAALDIRVGRGEAIPFGDECFDVVVMYDVLEHVVSPGEVIAECFRVLRAHGQLAVVFPPYYDTHGGSHLDGYATSLGGLNLFFSTRALKSATRQQLDRSDWQWQRFLRDIPTDKLWNQNGLTVRGFRHIISESPFRPVVIRYIGHMDSRLSHTRGLRRAALMPAFRLFMALAAIPILREGFCLRIAAILKKP